MLLKDENFLKNVTEVTMSNIDDFDKHYYDGKERFFNLQLRYFLKVVTLKLITLNFKNIPLGDIH